MTNYCFDWKIRKPELHIPRQKLEELRQISDDICDNALKVLNEKNITVDDYLNDIINYNQNPKNDIKYNDKELNILTKQILTYPEWLDFDIIRKGQLVFYKYASSSSMALLYFSLVGGFSAPKIVAVLDQTAYLTKGSYDSTFKRLNETLEMVLDVIENPDNLKIGNIGWQSVLKVRFIHSKVRDKIKKYNKNWDTKSQGIPINMEDMIGTLLSFSINVIETIKKIGAPITLEEEESYIHLWRYVGYLLGVSEEYNPCVNINTSIGVVESIILHILHPDERSGEVARHVLRSVSCRPLLNWSYYTHSEAARSLLGSQLSDELGLERSVKHYFYVKFILFFMMCFQYIISYLNINYNHDSKFIKRTKIIMRSAVNKALKKY